jgi:hypothetical protein
MMLVRRASLLLAVCAACSFDHRVPAMITDGGDGDSPVTDGPEVTSDTRSSLCFGTFKTICLTALPTNDFVVDTERTINTDTGCPLVESQGTGQTLCVVVARTMHINDKLRASGPRPLVLLATETIDISGTGLVDVGSFKWTSGPVPEFIGAASASGATLCGAPTAGAGDFETNGMSGAGGGAGGSFGGQGGAGARGLNSGGGVGGVSANATGAPSYMRGGCRGTSGGSGNGNVTGAGGAGGGAALLIAGSAINNAGQVRAGGMGGYGGGDHSGGGGGGAGGMIVLDSPAINNSGVINANGGGGGEGGGYSPGGGGSSALTGTGPAEAGTGNAYGGDGGAGSWATTLTGEPGATGSFGGGGGAGGAGVIRIYPAVTLAGIVSPPPS